MKNDILVKLYCLIISFSFIYKTRKRIKKKDRKIPAFNK